MSYQAYPGGANEPLPTTAGAPPKSVANAVRLMYAGAALSIIELILAVVSTGSIRSAVQKAARQRHTTLTHSQLSTVVTFDIAFTVAISLLAVGLWLWMARACGRGRSWARIVSSVLFGLNTLFTLINFARPSVSIGLVLNLLVWLAGLGAIIFLWQRDSGAFFQAGRA